MKKAARAKERFDVVFTDPQTLARDLLFLTHNGYSVERMQPVDMFPHTRHVETVCLMSRVEGK